MLNIHQAFQSFRFPILKLVSSVAIAFTLSQVSLFGPNYTSFDFLATKLPAPDTSGNILIVHLNQEDLKALGREPNLADFGLVLRDVSMNGSKGALVLNQLDISAVTKSQIDFFNGVMSNVSIPTIWGIDDRQADGRQPISKLADQIRGIEFTANEFSIDVVSFAADSIARRTIVSKPTQPMPITVIRAAGIIDSTFDLSHVENTFDRNNILQILTRHRPDVVFPTVSFTDVLERKLPASLFKDKFVIFGRDTEDWTDDYARTPLKKTGLGSPRTVVYASGIETLLNNDALFFGLNKVGTFVVTFLISYITLIVLFSLAPHLSLLVVTGIVVGIFSTAVFLFSAFQMILPIAQFLISLLITYYLFIPYRLIQESRKSWEYLQKNKLLTEVERLKTNFLSMMSHDLKTPLARIQGMTDMVLSQSDNLTAEQKSALKSIGASTDELTNFVSGILDLGRVESQEVKLQLQARDINSLLEEAIAKSADAAKAKNIQIIQEFEPLFSTKVDATLMRQVFANLIENAVKYSPEGSKILVSTEEVDGHIQVQIADQGIGIPPEELPHVFSKFYRSHSVKNGPIKGSGLGLFLAKYFVELHKGRVHVESVPQQGSTFTVDLPMN